MYLVRVSYTWNPTVRRDQQESGAGQPGILWSLPEDEATSTPRGSRGEAKEGLSRSVRSRVVGEGTVVC